MTAFSVFVPAVYFAGVLLLLALAPSSLTAQQLAFRAAFSNDTAAPQAILPYGWTLIEGGGPLASATVEPQISRRALDEFGAASPHGVGLAEGVLVLVASAVPRTVLVVTGAPAVQLPADSLHGLAWEWTGGNSRGHLSRPAIKVGGIWYVADCAPFLTVNASPFSAHALRAEFLFPAHDAAAWKPLSVPLSTDDTAAIATALVALQGYVEEIGLWLRFGGSPGVIRVDNFEVTLRK